ncbi:MAG: alpha/beta fold hydrolase [Bacteroidetes bacterium]|nr:alpha/beta fold hydrolase [Bacteroidota bacterium]
MPLRERSAYKRPKWLFNRHIETIYPPLFRQVSLNHPIEERLETSDGDFLELDWYRQDSKKLVIISHGLEGNSRRSYILGMCKEMLAHGFDVLAWNYRGCGKELNRKVIFYHSGATYDLDAVVSHASKNYDDIYLIGFSLGGNLTLKYLGEKKNTLPKLKKGVAVSVPLDLGSSCDKISSGVNVVYAKLFLKTLKEKIERKAQIFPKELELGKFNRIRTLRDFDNEFTGPMHGYRDAEEYYQINSSLPFLPQIEVPALILNAKNDPFLSESCYPYRLAKELNVVHFEFPDQGGHVGFTSSKNGTCYYSEEAAIEFILQDR